MLVVLAIVTFLGALVLGFLGGRDSMLSDLKRKEDELYDTHALIDKMNEERRKYFYAAEAEKEELQRQVDYLSKRLLEETSGKILDIPDNENGEEDMNEDIGSPN